jgi:hypothetical protein
MNEIQKEWWCVDLGQSGQIAPEVFGRFTESLLRFTPDLVQGKNRVFLEMGRTKKLFKLESVAARIRALGERLSVDSSLFRFGIGLTLPRAWVQTRWRTLDPRSLPLDAYFDFIDPIHQFQLNRAMNERLHVFRALGMKFIDSLFSVPKEAWLVRFGEEFDSFLENHEYGFHFSASRFVPEASLSETTQWNAEEYVLDADSLIFGIKPLIDRISGRLYSLHLALRKIEIRMKLDRPVPDRLIELSFTFPQTSRILLLKLLREKISFEMSREPLSDPVVEIEVKVLETLEREPTSERFAFSEKDEQVESEKERWLELVSYLGLKLKNRDDVFQAEVTEHPLPEKSWKKVLMNEPIGEAKLDRISHLFARRPIRFFSDPYPLFRMGPYLKLNHVLWKICEISEGERIAGHGWDADETEGFDRTYYRVKVSNAVNQVEDWWIYKDEQLGKLNLHGIY